jgi:coproporphyrinogen III oxidase
MLTRPEIEAFYGEFQDRFSAGIESLDGSARFVSDPWTRQGGGGGETRILANGRHIEKAAVNFSAVHGETPAKLSERITGAEFYATGVSIIVHPRNPYAPTFHANVRYFETDDGRAWFGGGADMTPYYLFPEDATHFHSVLAEVCGRHAVADYQGWKKACDEYFHLPHRGEARGIGGLFFDHLTDDLSKVWAFQQDLSDNLLAAYVPVLERAGRHPVRGTGDQLAQDQTRPVRRVQSRLGPGHQVRFGDRGSDRIDPRFSPATGRLGLRLRARTRVSGSRTTCRPPFTGPVVGMRKQRFRLAVGTDDGTVTLAS